MYKQTKTPPYGTSLTGYVEASFTRLIELFGDVEPMDGDKVAWQWVLRSPSGAIVTLYEYKETSVYSRSLPTPQAFREKYQDQPFKWHIGSKREAEAEKLAAYISQQ